MKPPRSFRSKPGFAAYAKASLLAGAAAAPVSALADFSGPYSVNPPANGTYNGASANGAFGNWTGAWNNFGAVTLNTGSAPSQISLSLSNASAFNTTGTYSFLVAAAATGLVSFNFSANNGFNASAMFVDMTTAFSSSLNGSNSFSTSVNAGDIFGFKLSATYFSTGSALTVSNFSGPIPTTGVPEQGSTLALFAFGFVGLMAYRAAAQRRAVARA